MRALGSVTAVVVQKVRRKTSGGAWARDGYGNPIYDELSAEVPGCSMQPSDSSESLDEGRNQVATTWTLYAPLAFPATAIDAVRVAGVRFEVLGQPLRWEHPRLGHVQVTLREVQG